MMKKLLLSAAVMPALLGATYAQDTNADDTGDTIVVQGIRKSLADAVTTKRNAGAIVDAISAEDIGKFPDKNVAESLQRIPGVVTNREFGEGERVSLRGLAPNQTRTFINGHAVATADWFVQEQLSATRNFNYLVLPSDIVGDLQVFKSPTAEVEEGGIGGTVNVTTRKPLDQDPLVAVLSIEAAYTPQADSTKPNVSGVLSWKNSEENFGVLVSAIYQHRDIRRDGFEVLGYKDSLDPDGLGRQIPTLIGSALFEQTRKRIGGNIEIQYQPNDALVFGLSGFVSKFGANNINANYMAWPDRAGLVSDDGTATLSDVVVEGNTIVAATVSNVNDKSFGQAYDIIARDAFSLSSFLTGDVTYRPDDTLELTAKLGYTKASGDTTNQPFVEFLGRNDFSYDLRGKQKVSFEAHDPTVPNELGFTEYDGFASNHEITNDDDELFFYGDAYKALSDLGPLTGVKAGIKFTDHARATDMQATTWGDFFVPLSESGCNGKACTPAFFGAGQTPDDYLKDIGGDGSLTNFFLPDRDIIRYTLGEFLDGLGAGGRVPKYNDIFSVDEETFGGYLMGEFEGDYWRGNAGVRIVETNQKSTAFRTALSGETVTHESAYGKYIQVVEERNYTDVLPSINLSLDLRDDLILRLAAARTMTRPDFTDIAPRVSLNEGAQTGTGGSADVKAYRANQLDASIEYYAPNDAVFAAAFYYKDVENFVTDTVGDEVFTIETGTPNAANCTATEGEDLYDCVFSINRRANGGTARIQGVELIAQTPIANGFGINTNFSYSDAEADSGAPVPGNSKYAYQIGGYYEDNLVSAQLTYNWRDDFFITYDRSTQLNQEGFGSLDASVDVRVHDQLTLTLDAVNLTDEEIRQFAGSPSVPRATYDNGRYFYFGARYQY